MQGSLRQNRQTEAQESVCSHLQQDSREDHRSRGRRLDVCVRQPGMEREHRDLDREAHKEGQENPILEVERQVRSDRMKRKHVKCCRCSELLRNIRMSSCYRRILEIERENSQEQQNRSNQCVQEELD